MATLELRAGVVPAATTSLPLLRDQFALLNPFNQKYADDFEAAGSLGGASLPIADPAKTWTVPSGTITKAAGRVTADSTIAGIGRVARFDTGLTEMEINALVQLGAASNSVGVLLRTQDSNNTLRVAISPTILAIQLYTGGTLQSGTASAAFAFGTGTDYLIYARAEGDVITARAMDRATLSVVAQVERTIATLNDKTGAGISLSGLQHSIADFRVAAL